MCVCVCVCAQPVARRRLPGGLGNPELTRLWALGANYKLEEQRGANVEVPFYEKFLEQVKEEADPENGIEESYRAANNPAFEWKAYRTVVQQKAALLNVPAMWRQKADLATLVTASPQVCGLVLCCVLVGACGILWCGQA